MNGYSEILDLGSPALWLGLNAAELEKHLREHCTGPKRVYISGTDSDIDAMKAPAADFA